MKQYTKNEIDSILKNHSIWVLSEGVNGIYADLRDANLIGANLSGANLHIANLRGANLRDADLHRANLRGADLRDADLIGANLFGANLSGANLHIANLRGADLRDANLRGANLSGANLSGANLSGANLSGSSLRNANIEDVQYDSRTSMYALACPEQGEFIGYKKANDYIVELLVTADAKRSSATTRKCRCSKAKVLAITNQNGEKIDIEKVASNYDYNFFYTVGETVEVSNFCEDRWKECAPGIHFFITREEAVRYDG